MALNRIYDPVQLDSIVIVDMECSAGLNYNTDMADTVLLTTPAMGTRPTTGLPMAC